MSKKQKVFVVAAHPDDEVLGCGATMAKFSKRGHDVYTLILGEGVTSRDEKRNRDKRDLEIQELKKQIDAVNRCLGAKKSFVYDFPDNRFDTVALLDIVKVIEKVKRDIKPTMIFTHFQGDLNVDHRITYEAVLTATRPLDQETVREIYSFEVLSSTEWNYPLSFSPNVFFDVSGTLAQKKKAMGIYKNELRDYPHPRSLEGIELNAEYWGMRVGKKYVEAFQSVRILK